MSQDTYEQVDNFLSELLIPADPALDDSLAASRQAGLPAIEVAPNLGALLMLLTKITGARRVLEIGTLGGYSTTWLARGLPAGGTLTTLEVEPAHAAVAEENLARVVMADRVEVRVGPATASLAALVEAGEEPFDLVFIDADKEGYPDYLEWSLRLTRPGSLIVADNVVRRGAVADPDSDDPRVQGVRRFLELVAAEPRLTATAVQTVGVKGWDGLALALVTD